MNTPVLILPGLGGSGPAHWQSLWEASDPSLHRVSQRDWDHPDLGEWLTTLEERVAACEIPPVLVAHSLGCASVAHWVQKCGGRAKAALLVSPSDVESAAHTPPEVRGFAPIPLIRFPFPSIVVASSNDPRVSLPRAEYFAKCWGSRLIVIHNAGHINAESKLDAWPEGQELLQELRRAP